MRTANDPDGFVTKFNADGSYAWTATLGGRGLLTVDALAPTPQGGVVASGGYQDTIDLDPSAAQDIHVTNESFQYDTYVVELAGNGAEVWGRTFPGTSFDASGASTGVAVDAAGAVYVAGFFSGTVDFDPGTGTASHTPPVDSSGFVVKLDSGGNFAWAQAFDDPDCTTALSGGHGRDRRQRLGRGLAGGGTDLRARARARKLPARRRADREVEQRRHHAHDVWTIGELDTDDGFAIAAGRNGGVYVGGMAADDVDMDPGPGVARRWFGAYSQSGFVLALAADGTYQWSRVLNGAEVDAMASAPDGGVIVTGSAGQAFVTRLTPNGDSVWTMPIGDSAVRCCSVASSGTSFAVAGTSTGTQDLDPGPSIDLLFGDVVVRLALHVLSAPVIRRAALVAQEAGRRVGVEALEAVGLGVSRERNVVVDVAVLGGGVVVRLPDQRVGDVRLSGHHQQLLVVPVLRRARHDRGALGGVQRDRPGRLQPEVPQQRRAIGGIEQPRQRLRRRSPRRAP